MKNKKNLLVFGIMLLAVFVLTWVIPSSTAGAEGLELGTIIPTGYADIFATIEILLNYFAKPAIFILFVGMFYGVINKSGVYKALVDKIANVFKKKKILFLILTVLFYGLVPALTGIYIPMFMFVPLSIAILNEFKYKKVQTILATVGATTIGYMSEISSKMFSNLSGVTTNTYLWIKVGLFVLAIAVTILYLIKVGAGKEKKDKKEEENKNENMFVPEKRDAVKTSKSKGLSLFIVLCLMFAVFVLGLKAWDTTIFTTFYTNIQNIKIGEFAIFKSILGSFEAFGAWTYNSLFATITLAIIVLAIANKLTFKETIESSIEGAKKVIGLAFIALLINIVVIFTLNSGFLSTIVNLIAKSGKTVFVTIASFISTPFMVEEAYAAQYILQLFYSVTSSDTMLEFYSLIIQVTYGFVMLFVPSSVLLMVGLNYVEEDYTKWFKYIWRLLVVIFVLVLIAITIATLI